MDSQDPQVIEYRLGPIRIQPATQSVQKVKKVWIFSKATVLTKAGLG